MLGQRAYCTVSIRIHKSIWNIYVSFMEHIKRISIIWTGTQWKNFTPTHPYHCVYFFKWVKNNNAHNLCNIILALNPYNRSFCHGDCTSCKEKWPTNFSKLVVIGSCNHLKFSRIRRVDDLSSILIWCDVWAHVYFAKVL